MLDPNYKAVAEALNTVLFDQLRILADAAEDLGQYDRADGLRWLADNKRLPEAGSSYDYISRPTTVRGVYCWMTFRYWIKELPCCLPSARFPDGVVLDHAGGYSVEYRSLREAYEAPAESLGRWLRHNAKRRARQKQREKEKVRDK